MRFVITIGSFVVGLAALAFAAAAAAAGPQLSLTEKAVKVQNGKIALHVSCTSDDECNSVVTARVPMPGGILIKKGGLGGKIFTLQNGESKALGFPLTAEVRRWLKTHPRTTLIVGLKSSDSEFDNDWSTQLRLPLRA
jgi:hypothetical protein